MTTMFKARVQCAVCGKDNEFYEIGSTNSFGSMDLDTRPPEMQRSTMSHWVQVCPHCGYVSSEISDEPTKGLTEDLLKEYWAEASFLTSELAQKFYVKYKIELLKGDVKSAFFAILHAAWACDDNVLYSTGDAKEAVRCRELALGKLSAQWYDDKDENIKVLRADVLRRAGHFQELLEEYKSVAFENELLNTILAFQKHLAKQQNTGCYTVEDAINWQKQ